MVLLGTKRCIPYIFVFFIILLEMIFFNYVWQISDCWLDIFIQFIAKRLSCSFKFMHTAATINTVLKVICTNSVICASKGKQTNAIAETPFPISEHHIKTYRWSWITNKSRCCWEIGWIVITTSFLFTRRVSRKTDVRVKFEYRGSSQTDVLSWNRGGNNAFHSAFSAVDFRYLYVMSASAFNQLPSYFICRSTIALMAIWTICMLVDVIG